MASVKIILRKKPNKDGSYPLALQIIKDRKTSIITLGYNINKLDWDSKSRQVKKSYANSVQLNRLLATRQAEALAKVIDEETTNKQVTAQSIKKKIKPTAGATFFPQAEDYLKDLKKSGDYNQHTANKPRIKRFKEFLSNGDIAFADITPGLLDKFVVYLRTCVSGKVKKKRLGERTIVNHLAVIRSIFAHARKNHVITKEQNPFGGEGGTKIKFPESTKAGISNDDVKKLEDVQLENESYDHARNLWLISYYFGGMRISDVLRMRWSDFTDLRLHYTMGKNNKAGSIKVTDKALGILEKYERFKENENDLVFPDLKGLPNLDDKFPVQRSIAFATSRHDKFLRLHVAPAAGIKQKLTMHIARHTFATNAGDIVAIQTLQKIYRHSNVATTIAYQANFINQETDDAVDRILGLTS